MKCRHNCRQHFITKILLSASKFVKKVLRRILEEKAIAAPKALSQFSRHQHSRKLSSVSCPSGHPLPFKLPASTTGCPCSAEASLECVARPKKASFDCCPVLLPKGAEKLCNLDLLPIRSTEIKKQCFVKIHLVKTLKTFAKIVLFLK